MNFKKLHAQLVVKGSLFQKYFNLIPSFLIILVVLCSRYLSFVPRPNEEQYLALSKYFMDNEWIPNCINLNEFPGTRLLYQIITGTLLKFTSFENLVFSGRFILALGFSITIAKIYKTLNVSNIFILLHLAILFFLRQSYFAGSWIFLSFEAKSFSYIFIMLAFLFFMKGKYRFMTLSCIVASYFHILVGFFTFFYFCLSILLFEKKLFNKNLIREVIIYVVLILPIVLYMKQALTLSREISNISTDWIYSYFRNPHHTVIFKDWNSFKGLHLRGVLTSVLSSIFLFLLYFKFTSVKEKKLTIFSIVTLSISVLLIAINFIDSEGIILKYYLHRINTLGVFFSLLVYTILFQKIIKNSIVSKIIPLIIFVFAMFKLFDFSSKVIKHNSDYFNKQDIAYLKMCSSIKNITDSSDVVLYLTKDNHKDGQLDFNRKTHRSRFVIHKFVPGDMSKITDWYNRLKARDEIFKNIENLEEASVKYRIDYVLAKRSYDNFELVAEHYPYRLYKNPETQESK